VNDQLRAEVLKQRSTTTTLYLLLAMVGLVGLAVALHALALGADRLATRADQLDVFEVGTRVGMIFAALMGAMAITAEIRHGTIRPTFLVKPQRSPVIAAKLVVSALAGLALGLLAEALMAAAASAAFAVRGIDGRLSSADHLQLVLGGAVAAGLWAVIGLGVGAALRDQTATLVGLVVWLLLVENLLIGFVPGPSRFLPGSAGSDLAGNTDALPVAAATALLVIYAAAAAAAGWIATLRRDVA
jgi:ABC-type transport system involved in multi-copper enzyme maturation permease subunit